VTIRAQLHVGDLSALLEAAEEAPVEALERGALAAKKTIIRVLQQKVGPEQRLSGTASNAKVGVRYEMSRTGSAQALVRATGPWPLFNNRTAPHLIIARALGTRSTAQRVSGRLGATVAFGGTGRGTFRGSTREFVGSKRSIAEGRATRAKRAITTPDGLRAYAFHPGTAGSRTWQRGVALAEVPVTDAMQSKAISMMAAAMKEV
jgi:hypothetical protein